MSHELGPVPGEQQIAEQQIAVAHELGAMVVQEQMKRDRLRRFLRGVGSAALAVTLVTSAAVVESVSTASPAAADTLSYPWSDAPCEWGSAGGDTCTNPSPPYDSYDWGEYDSNNVFHPYRNGYEYRNCTDYVQWKEATKGVAVPSGWGNGGQWYDSAPAGERSSTPKAWDAAVVPGNPGHVAFVESVNSDGTITVSEYNHDTHGDGDTRTGNAASMGFTEFVDFGKHPSSGGNYSGSDFDTDGNDDIAWHQGSTLFMLNGTGAGTFGIEGSSGGFGTPDWVGSGVNDSDGTPEVYWHQGNTLYTLEWNGTGWSIVDSIGGIGTPNKATVGDFDKDGIDDIAWDQGSTLYMLKGMGDGRFSIITPNQTWGTPDWMGTGINNAHSTDQVYWHQGTTLSTLSWEGTGWSIAAQTGGIGTPDAAVTGDFDKDGYTDIAWHQGTTLFMLKATDFGTFGVDGSTTGIGSPDWSGGGENSSSHADDVYWHQGSSIYDMLYNKSTHAWSVRGTTNGITTPDAATSSNPNL